MNELQIHSEPVIFKMMSYLFVQQKEGLLLTPSNDVKANEVETECTAT